MIERLLKLSKLLGSSSESNIEDQIACHKLISKFAKENVPDDKELWQRAQREAKKRYKVHPSAYCVPLDSEALTREGWAHYDELEIGQEILAYDIEKDLLKWSKIEDLHYFEDAGLIRMYKQSLDIRCTPEHKWVNFRESIKPSFDKKKMKDIWGYIEDIRLGKRKISKVKRNEFSSIQHLWQKYKEVKDYKTFLKKAKTLGGCTMKAAEDMSFFSKILVTAKYKENGPSNFNFKRKYRGSWLSDILNMSFEELEAFTAACIMCDGWQISDNLFGFSQKDIDHKEAFELAAFLTGKRVVTRKRENEGGIHVTTVNLKRYIPMCNTKIEKVLPEDVWCPQTRLRTWVMRQNGHILITGNSNSFAAKWYKEKGGTWSKKNKSEDQENYVYEDSGLGKWHKKEKWVDISRKEDGKHPPCGRDKAKSGKYPKCRPKDEAKNMTKKEKANATRQKRDAERKKPKKGKGNKPTYESHKKKD